MSSWADRLRSTLPEKPPPPAPQNVSNSNNGNNSTAAGAANSSPTPTRKRSSSVGRASPILLLAVFEFLQGRELAFVCARVCHSWRGVVNEPGAWRFAWRAHCQDIELSFGRACFDPLDGILRIAGLSNFESAEYLLRQQQEEQQENFLQKLSSTSSSSQQPPQSSSNLTTEDLWKQLEARGGPATYSDAETQLIFTASARQLFGEQHSRLVKSGAYRLRYILSTLAHSHELRRDLNFQDSFAHHGFAKVHPRRTWTRMLKAIHNSQQQQQQQAMQQPQRSNSDDGTTANAAAAGSTSSAGAAPLPIPTTNNNDDDDDNSNNNNNNNNQNSTSQQQQQSAPSSVSRSSATRNNRTRTSRVRIFSFVNKQLLDALLESMNDHNGENNNGDANKEQQEQEQQGEKDDDDQDEQEPRGGGNVAQQQLQQRRQPSLKDLDMLNTLRAATSFTSLTSQQIFNMFSHMQADAPLPSSVPYTIVDSTECVDAEDETLLSDLTGVFFGIVSPAASAASASAAANAPVGLNLQLPPSQQQQQSSSRRRVRLIEVTLEVASKLLRSATKVKERETALALVGDFALRPLSQMHSPEQPEYVHPAMKANRVGRSPSPPLSPVLPPPPPPSSASTRLGNNNTVSPPSFLNARWQQNQVQQEAVAAAAASTTAGGGGRDLPFPSEVSRGNQEAPQPNICLDELSMRDCLSCLLAPRFFTGPELCGGHSVGLIVVDALRIVVLKLRG